MEGSSLDSAHKWVVNKFVTMFIGSIVAFSICLAVGLLTESLLLMLNSGVLALLFFSLIFTAYKIDYFYG